MSDSIQVNQNHVGNGDNIGGNKIVYSLSAPALESHVEEVFLNIFHGKTEDAYKILENLDNISSKDQETTHLLDCLKLRISIVKNEVPDNSRAKMLKILNSNPNSTLTKDLAISTFIRLLVFLEKKEDALSSYQQLNGKLYKYSQDVYAANLATKDELKIIYETRLSLMDEVSLIVLANSLSTAEMHTEAVIVCKKLIELSPKYENQLIQMIASTIKLNHEVKKVPFIYLDRDKSEEILELVKNFSSKVEEKFILNQQEATVLHNLLVLTDFNVWSMLPEHLKNIQQINSVSPETGALLDQSSKDSLDSVEVTEQNLLNNKILTNREISSLIHHLSEGRIKAKLAKDWLSQKPTFEDQDEFSRVFFILFFESLIGLDENSTPQEINSLEKSIEKFVNENQKSIQTINPILMNILCDFLANRKDPLYLSINRLLEKALPQKKILSPLYIHYLHSLFHLDQIESLDRELMDTTKYDQSIPILLVKKEVYLLKNDVDSALRCIDSAIQISPNSPNLWLQKLEVTYKKLGESHAIALLKDIPEGLFKKPRHNLYVLLQFIANNLNLEFSEKKLFGLFLQHPSDEIIQVIIKIHLGSTINRRNSNYEIYDDIENFHGGVVYSLSGKNYTKILVSNTSSNHSFFLNIDSPIGLALKNMQINDVREYDFSEIKLIEKKSTQATIFELAFSSFEDIQQRSDQPLEIHSFSVSEENPVEDVKKIINRINKNNNRNKIYQSPELPIYMKGSWLNQKNEAQSAAQLLYLRGANSALLHDFGVKKPNNNVLLDVYSFMYICITGLDQILIKNSFCLYFSVETQRALTAWLDEITHPDYMTLDLAEDQLIISNSQTVEIYHKELITSFKHLLKITKIIDPEICNVPAEDSQIKKIFGESVYSTFKICYSKKIPWLCLDHMLSRLFLDGEKCQLISPSYFFSELSKTLSAKDKNKLMALSAYYGLHTFFTYEDIFQLSKSNDQDDFHLLYSLLENYSLHFENFEHFMDICSEIIKNNFRADLAFQDLKISRIKTVFNLCCKISLKKIDLKEPIDRISAFFLKLAISGKFSKNEWDFIFHVLITTYATGHFMDIYKIYQKVLEIIETKPEIKILPNQPTQP